MNRKALLFLIAVFSVLALLSYIASPPKDFPIRSIISIEEGESVEEAGEKLEAAGVIRSSEYFGLLIRFVQKGSLIAGSYSFDSRESVYGVVDRLSSGDYAFFPVRVTIPEGYTTEDIARLFSEELQGFEREAFLDDAEAHEGYLFPDTYEFFPTASEEDVLMKLRETFTQKTEDLRKRVLSEREWEEIVVMASILEKEAHDRTSRRMIADILWRRLDDEMLLQVDAPFLYLLGKTSEELTKDDLALDSPYNTYVNKGLPPGPIGNPGLDALEAALNPIPNTFVYYLADSFGVTHFSTTYEEHTEKIERYLR